jgi:hypothetical protein
MLDLNPPAKENTSMRYDPFVSFNRIFAEIDHAFRQAESDYHVILPTISIPSVTHYEDRRVYSDGQTEKHFKDGALHRDDGPAVITYDDKGKIATEAYYLEGEKVSKETLEEHKQKIEDERIHNVYLGNKAYRVNGKKLRELEKLFADEPKKIT